MRYLQLPANLSKNINRLDSQFVTRSAMRCSTFGFIIHRKATNPVGSNHCQLIFSSVPALVPALFDESWPLSVTSTEICKQITIFASD
jgi:hypothetical protein